MPSPATESASTAAEATRARILDEAIRAFASQGFAAISTRKLAAAADVNIATLSYHFGNKQGVYKAAVAEVYRRIGTLSTDLLPELAGLELREALAAIYRATRRESDCVAILFREVLDHGRLTDETQNAHFLPSVTRHAALVAALLSIEESQARRAMVTLSFLIGRFAIQEEASLALALGLDDPADAEEAVIDCLYSTATSFLS